MVGKVILLAPSLGWHYDRDTYFGQYSIDPNLVGRTRGMTVFNSTNDGEGIQKSVKELRETIKDLRYREFNYGHFTSRSMQSTEFPELFEECMR